MTQAFQIGSRDQDALSAIRSFLAMVMEKAGIDAMLVPTRLAMKNRLAPTLISDPVHLASADPLSPSFPVNAAAQLARLTRQPAGGRLAAVLRPCEIRAFNELVKLNQGRRDGVVIIACDCAGALSNRDFRGFADQHESLDAATATFLACAAAETNDTQTPPLTSACDTCLHPVPATADIVIEWFGTTPPMDLTARAGNDNGQAILSALELPLAEMAPQRRRTAIDRLLDGRRKRRDERNAGLAKTLGSLPGLSSYLADCVNCYNCRVACPVCYCTTCVFTTDTFRHEPFQYLQWARRKGSVKMPTDTLFFHLTRMAHMSCACVGCGQCTNACPNDIPLSDLFTYVAQHTQAAFGYAAGQDVDTRPPMSGFEAEEYEEVVGL